MARLVPAPLRTDLCAHMREVVLAAEDYLDDSLVVVQLERGTPLAIIHPVHGIFAIEVARPIQPPSYGSEGFWFDHEGRDAHLWTVLHIAKCRIAERLGIRPERVAAIVYAPGDKLPRLTSAIISGEGDRLGAALLDAMQAQGVDSLSKHAVELATERLAASARHMAPSRFPSERQHDDTPAGAWGVGFVEPYPLASVLETADIDAIGPREAAARVLDGLADIVSRPCVSLDATGLRLLSAHLRADKSTCFVHYTSRRKPSSAEVRARAKQIAGETASLMRQLGYPTAQDLKDAQIADEFEFRQGLAEMRDSCVLIVHRHLRVYPQQQVRFLWRSWLHLRASIGDGDAMIETAWQLETDGLPDPDEATILAEAWRRLYGVVVRNDDEPVTLARKLIAMSAFDIVDDADRVLQGLHRHLEFPLPPATADTPGKRGGSEEGLRVLTGIGDAASAEGVKAAKAFAPLMRPIPLVGHPDPDDVWRHLSTEFPWMSEANLAIARAAAVSRRGENGAFVSRPLLLHGAPGVGKSRYARRVAEICGVPFDMISLAGAGSSVLLKGVERGFSAGRASAAALAFLKHRCANPLLLCDEVDKADQSRINGSPLDVLLTLLEPETACRFGDDFLLGQLDCSAISWILTANDIAGLPGPLLSRVRIVRAGRPEARHFAQIYDGVLADVARDLRLPFDRMPDISAIRPALERDFAADLSMRSLKTHVADEVQDAIWRPAGPRAVA